MEREPATITVLTPAEVRLSGRSISPGLGMGRAWVLGDVLQWSGPSTQIGQDDVDGELVRLAHSVEETLAELDQYAKRIEGEFDSTLAGIFRAHGEMLRGLFATGEFERELRASLLTAEAVVGRVLQRWYQKFETLENQTLRQRADDVLDLGRTIIRRLRGEQDPGLKAIPEHSILVVERLLPSDVVLLPKSNVVAVVVQALGQGSHAAILAREKGIPTITEIPGILSLVSSGTELLVDGFRGTLVIAPTIATRTDFQERMEKWRATLVRCKGACRDPARTLDGQLVSVEANIGIHDDAELALDNGADGVGLLRIEQLYFARPMPPTEDELFRELESLIAPLGNRPVTIRLLDVGGDKQLPYLALPPTSNPGLGRRGVRLLLNYSQLVRTQMGAILQTVPGAFVARADSDGHSGRRYSPDAGSVRRDEHRAKGHQSARVWRDGGDARGSAGNSRALEARRLLLHRHKRPYPIHHGRCSRRRLGQRLLSGWPRVGHATIKHRCKRGRRSARNALRGVGRARNMRATLAENGISRVKRCSLRHSHNEGINPHSQY